MVQRIRLDDFSAHASTMSRDLPYCERLASFAAAGFTKVETWWPFPSADPGVRDVDAFLSTLHGNGLELVGLNFYEGNLHAGDRGAASRPELAPALECSIEVAARIGAETGCANFNLLYGNVDPDMERGIQDRQALVSLRRAVDAVAGSGGRVLLEPLSTAGNPAYPLRTPQDALTLLAGLDDYTRRHTGLLFDAYHLAAEAMAEAADDCAPAVGSRLADAAREFAATAAHVQFADCPGRGSPGSGMLDLRAFLRTARQAGYSGEFGCEFLCTAAETAGIGGTLAGLLRRFE
jgi:hydroxypyruvate isomerase